MKRSLFNIEIYLFFIRTVVSKKHFSGCLLLVPFFFEPNFTQRNSLSSYPLTKVYRFTNVIREREREKETEGERKREFCAILIFPTFIKGRIFLFFYFVP